MELIIVIGAIYVIGWAVYAVFSWIHEKLTYGGYSGSGYSGGSSYSPPSFDDGNSFPGVTDITSHKGINHSYSNSSNLPDVPNITQQDADRLKDWYDNGGGRESIQQTMDNVNSILKNSKWK